MNVLVGAKIMFFFENSMRILSAMYEMSGWMYELYLFIGCTPR